MVARGAPRRGRSRRARAGRARRRAGRTSFPQASTCGRASTSTAEAPTASTTGPRSSPTSTTSGSIASIPARAPVAITPAVGAQAPPVRRRAHHARRRPLDRRPRAASRERPLGDVVNELVAVPTDGSSEPRVIAGGRDFYSNPRISPDGSRLCFLAWNLPWMPWDGCELFVADLAAGRRARRTSQHVAGADGEESIWQPEWSPAGDLVFASDRSGWWNLERIRGDERSVLYAAEAEFGYPAWVFGSALVRVPRRRAHRRARYDSDGLTSFGVLDPETGAPRGARPGARLLVGARRTSAPTARRVVVVAGSRHGAQSGRVRSTSRSGTREVLRASAEVPVEHGLLLGAARDRVPDRGRPHRPRARATRRRTRTTTAPEGEAPPLIVMSHGGPTGNATAIFDLETQFWTSRGFAVVDVNYGGSTGYGRAYRERLNGEWGVVDLQDCVNAARLPRRRRARPTATGS